MVKTYRPVTPGQRELVMSSKVEITKAKPLKALVSKSRKQKAGRNQHGHITCRHKGGGHKRLLRIIDFKRDKDNILAKVASIEYDPNRSSFIALLNYVDGEKRYILASQGMKVGDMVSSGENAAFNPGCSMKLKNMPLGSLIHNIEMYPGRGGTLIRSAGLGAQLLARSEGYATIKMPSGEIRMVNEDCRATFGAVSNPEHNLRVEGKAGRVRWMGVRPTVRGTAMNPVDHPMGGGEGKGKGNHPQSPWSVYAKGFRTRSKKKNSKFIVERRRK